MSTTSNYNYLDIFFYLFYQRISWKTFLYTNLNYIDQKNIHVIRILKGSAFLIKIVKYFVTSV